ncbi:hypothetical protein [Mycolicibacterium sp. XJ870]
MKVKRPEPTRDGDRRRAARQPVRAAQRRGGEAPPRTRRQTGPIPRPRTGPARPKSASQAKARAKARKAKSPKVIRPPLRERLLVRLASVELNPRALIARVPFVVLVIAALGLGLATTLWLSTGSAERSYQLGHARQTNEGLLQQKEALERDVLEAQAAPALAEAARNLGMIPSRDTAHLVQDPTGNWTVVGTPKPAEGVPPPPLNTPLPDDTPPPPSAPAPRVVEPREMTVRVPQAGQPALALPGAVPGVAPVEVPHGVAAAVPPAPGPVPPAGGPAVLPVVPPEALHLPVTGVPVAPGPAAAVEQFTPAVAPVA